MGYSAHRLLAQTIRDMGVTFYSSDELHADGGDDAEIPIEDALIPEAFFTSILAHATHALARQSIHTQKLNLTDAQFERAMEQALALNPLGAKFYFDPDAMFGLRAEMPEITSDALSSLRIFTIFSSAVRQLGLVENARIDLTERFVAISQDMQLLDGLKIEEPPSNSSNEQFSENNSSQLGHQTAGGADPSHQISNQNNGQQGIVR
jgi:hypothetical protein